MDRCGRRGPHFTKYAFRLFGEHLFGNAGYVQRFHHADGAVGFARGSAGNVRSEKLLRYGDRRRRARNDGQDPRFFPHYGRFSLRAVGAKAFRGTTRMVCESGGCTGKTGKEIQFGCASVLLPRRGRNGIRNAAKGLYRRIFPILDAAGVPWRRAKEI